MDESRPEADRGSLEPVRSELAGDADMIELVKFFVTDLQGKIDAIGEAWRGEDIGRLRRVIRQLEETGSGYGFPSITQAAGELHRNLLPETAEVSGLGDQVEGLVALCRRVSAESSS